MKAFNLVALILLTLSVTYVHATVNDSLEINRKGCQNFIAKLQKLPRVTYGVVQVPKDWKSPERREDPGFLVETRAGTRPTRLLRSSMAAWRATPGSFRTCGRARDRRN